MGDFFAYRRMLAPLLIHIFFWVATLGCLATGGAILGGAIKLEDLMAGDKALPVAVPANLHLPGGDQLKLIVGLCFMILGPIGVRLYCELLMLPFRINGTLTDIRNALQERPEVPARPTARR